MTELRTPGMRRSRSTPTPGSDCDATRHGTYSSARWGCRCPDALEDRWRYEKRETSGRLIPAMVDATGTVRRLQALNTLGYGGKFLAERLGTARPYALKLMSGRGGAEVHRSTAGRVAELYRELAGLPAKWNPDIHPDKTPAQKEALTTRTAEYATQAGYVPPGRWGDGDIDRPDAAPEATGDARMTAEGVRDLVRRLDGLPDDILQGYRDLVTAADRASVVAELTAAGRSISQIAELLGIEERTVERHRATASDDGDTPQADTTGSVRAAVAAVADLVDDDPDDDTRHQDGDDDQDAAERLRALAS